MEYAKVDPFGEERADLRMAIATSATVNCWIGKGRKAKPEDFMPNFETKEKPQQTPDAMKAMLRKWTAMCGGTIAQRD